MGKGTASAGEEDPSSSERVVWRAAAPILTFLGAAAASARISEGGVQNKNSMEMDALIL
jgi:hypothetical protein